MEREATIIVTTTTQRKNVIDIQSEWICKIIVVQCEKNLNII